MADLGRDDQPKGRCRVGDRAPCALSSGNRPRPRQFVESDAWRLALGQRSDALRQNTCGLMQ